MGIMYEERDRRGSKSGNKDKCGQRTGSGKPKMRWYWKQFGIIYVGGWYEGKIRKTVYSTGRGLEWSNPNN